MTFLKTRRLSSLALLILAATSVMSAQNPAPRPAQTPTFRSGTDLVYTEVRARDSAGRFLPDLTLKDFDVYEDGKLQTATSFVAIIGGRAMNEIVPTAEPVREGLVLPPVAKPPTQVGRIFIIFIDDLHLQPMDSIKAKQVLKEIRDTLIHDGDLVGLVSSGYSSVSFDLSPDPKRLRFNQAIEKTMGAGMTAQEIITANSTANGPAGLRANAYTAFKTAYDILDQAEKVTNRRKAFIYVSSGYDFNPLTDSRFKALQALSGVSTQPQVENAQAMGTGGQDPLSALANEASALFRNPFEMNGQQFANADLASALGELVNRARRASVAFYPIDPRGLVAGPDISTQIPMEEYNRWVTTSLMSLDTIAGETGGKCICRTNDFKKGLQQVDNEMSDYYIIGYESNNPDPLRVIRRVEIKLKRDGAAKTVATNWYSIKNRKK